jgi:hypothetical protein
VTRGAVVTIAQAWELAQKWYGNRLERDFRRPTVDEAHAIFESVGLSGPFWRLS